jgi:hypothetical protein
MTRHVHWPTTAISCFSFCFIHSNENFLPPDPEGQGKPTQAHNSPQQPWTGHVMSSSSRGWGSRHDTSRAPGMFLFSFIYSTLNSNNLPSPDSTSTKPDHHPILYHHHPIQPTNTHIVPPAPISVHHPPGNACTSNRTRVSFLILLCIVDLLYQ